MASVPEVWQDRDFLRLPPTEKQKVMQSLDPDFQGLPDAEQKRVVFQLSESKGPVQEATPLMSSHSPNQRVIPEKSYIQRVADPENMKRYGQWLTSPGPGPQEGESAVGRMVKNIPESALKLPFQVAAGGYQLVKNVTDPLVEGAFGGENTLSNLGHGAMNTVDMVSRGFGEPIGLYGLDRAKERWVTDPVGSAVAVAPFAPEAVKMTGRGVKAVGKGTGAVADAVTSRVGPEGLYNSALKMTTSERVSVAERSKRAQTGLEGGYMPTEKGYNRLLDDIDSVNQQIGESIKGAASSGKTIAVEDVLKRLEPIKERALNDINPQPILETIAGIEENLRNHPLATDGQIPIDVAQKMKIETYRGLKKAYGEMKSSEVEARKSVARGLKEEIASMVPEISELNAKDSALIGLEDSLERATKRIANRDIVGIGGPLKVGAGVLADLAGGHGAGTIAGLAAWAFDVPQVKSALAIAMYRARKAAGKASPMSKIRAEISQMAAKLKDDRGLIAPFGGDINDVKGAKVQDGTPFKIRYGSTDMSVIRNPSPEQGKAFMGQVIAENERRGIPYDKHDNLLRWVTDENTGDVYFAPAYFATHEDIAANLGISKSTYQGQLRNERQFDVMATDPYMIDKRTRGQFSDLTDRKTKVEIDDSRRR